MRVATESYFTIFSKNIYRSITKTHFLSEHVRPIIYTDHV